MVRVLTGPSIHDLVAAKDKKAAAEIKRNLYKRALNYKHWLILLRKDNQHFDRVNYSWQ